MGDCYIVRRGGFGAANKLPAFTYTGKYLIRDNGNGNWFIALLTSGVLRFRNSVSTMDMFILGAGGAGANTGGTAVGGGGYYLTVEGIAAERNIDYSIVIGAGGDELAEDGGFTSAFGQQVEGGKGATAGAPKSASCRVTSYTGETGKNVYYYPNLSADRQSVGNGYQTVQLAYPLVTATHENGLTMYAAASGGYYLCAVSAVLSIAYGAGANGEGAPETQIFGNGDTVGGPGGTGAEARNGQGGGSVNIVAGSGLVVLRNSASVLSDTSALDAAVLGLMKLV